MKSFSLQTSSQELAAEIQQWKDKNLQVILMFSSTELLKDGRLCQTLKQALPETEIIGCSTAGEIGNRVDDDSISLLGFHFDSARIKCVQVEINSPDTSFEAGRALAEELNADDLVGIFTLAPGLNVNGSKFVNGLKHNLPSTTTISGGLAGNGLDFKETVTVYNTDISPTHAVGFGLYGDSVTMKNGSGGGWRPFGPLRRVTKVENNILYELDGKSALGLYKEYLGEKAADLPSSGLLYPFAIMDNQTDQGDGLIRTILDIDEKAGSLILAGDIENGKKVCLMHANTDELVEGAENAAETAKEEATDSDENNAVICVSCVGRKIVMGEDTEDELDAVKDVFGNAPIAGFYSYGEISHFQDTGKAELHNQTMTVTRISEHTK